MVNDPRLGYRDSAGKITAFPQRYPDNGFFNKFANPAPTQIWITENYFCVLPVGKTSITDELYEELNAIILNDAAAAKKEKEDKKAEKAEKAEKVEPEKVVEAVEDDSDAKSKAKSKKAKEEEEVAVVEPVVEKRIDHVDTGVIGEANEKLEAPATVVESKPTKKNVKSEAKSSDSDK